MSDRPITVQMFAVARDLAGSGTVTVSLPLSATVGDLRRALLDKHPALKKLGGALRLAVNADYAQDGDLLGDAVDVACIPPVSGG